MAKTVAARESDTRAAVEGRDVLLVRGERVMLDHRVADAFGTETKRVNEAVARNPEKFDDRHVFQLSEAEHRTLRSHTATTNTDKVGGGRGGTRYRPHVFTLKGVARLATVLDTPAALKATDLIIDTFVMVQAQIGRGRRTVSVADPDRYRAGDEQRLAGAKLRAKLASQISRLLDTIVDVDANASLGDVSKVIGSEALANIQERLRSKGLENAKLEADAGLVLAQAEKVLAEARKTREEADGLNIDNFQKRIAAARKMVELIRELEPPEVIELFEDFSQEPLRLEAPDED